MHLFCSGAPPRNGCSAPVLVAVVGVVGVFWASVVFCLGHFVVPLWRLVLWFLRNVARNSPTCISNVEITSLEFCGFLDTYEKLEYPNYVRLLVDEATKANSCVRSSSHDCQRSPGHFEHHPHTPQCEEPENWSIIRNFAEYVAPALGWEPARSGALPTGYDIDEVVAE